MADTNDSAVESIKRIQEFDPLRLDRKDDLGRDFSFSDAVAPARKLINFYKQVPTQYIDDLPEGMRIQLRDNANSFYNTIQEILDFQPSKVENPNQSRSQIINRISQLYESHFNSLYQIVSYLVSRQQDFSVLENRARAAVQTAEDNVNRLQESLQESEAEAKRILDDVRKTSAEQGVSQKAYYFSQESINHDGESKKWQKYTVIIAIGLGVFSLISLPVGKVFLIPTTSYEAFQLGLSKSLIFITIAFMLILSARTLMAHRHNSVVNKHRQNALLTFNALVDASGGSESKDIILNQASSCIFSPQESGFNKSNASGGSYPSLIEFIPRAGAASGQ